VKKKAMKSMKGGKKVSGCDYAEESEEMEAKRGRKSDDKWERSKPADIAGAFKKAEGKGSKKLRVKPDKMKGKGR
jgi:hypothetical protein